MKDTPTAMQMALSRCPKCHKDKPKGMWVGLFPGEPCIRCNTTLVHLSDDPNRPEEPQWT